MPREHVFPSIEWVIARHQPRSVISFARFPPFPPFQAPTKPRQKYRRYEPYMWAYILPPSLRRQQRAVSEFIHIEMVDIQDLEPCLNIAKANDLMEASTVDSRSIKSTKEVMLAEDTLVSSESRVSVSPVRLWAQIKSVLNLFIGYFRRAFSLSSPQRQLTSPC